MVDGDAIRAAGQVEPPPWLDAGTDREHEQRVAARIGHVAPRSLTAAVDAGHVRRPDARRRSSHDASGRVAQLDDALAAEQDHAAPACEGGDVTRGALGRGQVRHTGRAAPGERAERADRQRCMQSPGARDERGTVS